MASRGVAYGEMRTKNGVPREQARAHALALETFISDEQATKSDLETLG